MSEHTCARAEEKEAGVRALVSSAVVADDALKMTPLVKGTLLAAWKVATVAFRLSAFRVSECNVAMF